MRSSDPEDPDHHQEEADQATDHNIVEADKKDLPNANDPKDTGESRKKNKGAKKAKKKIDISDPIKIVVDIISKSNFKSANLSQIIQEKFYHAPDYHDSLCKKLSNIVYEPTVGPTNEGLSDIEISVLPEGINGEVNVKPAALLNLPCIYENPKKRTRNRKNKNKSAKQQTNNKPQTQQQTQETTEQEK